MKKTRKQLQDLARLKTEITEGNYCPVVESSAETEHNPSTFTESEDPLRQVDMRSSK